MTENLKAGRWDFDRILNQLLVVVTIGILGHLIYAWYANELEELKSLQSFNPTWLAVGCLSMISIWFAHGAELYTWAHLFKRKLPVHDSIKIAMATDLGVAVVPNFIGGGPIKVSMLIKKGFTTDEAATVLAMNPISEFLFFAWFIPTSIILGHKRYDSRWAMESFTRTSMIHPLATFLIVVALMVLCWWLWRGSKNRVTGTPRGNQLLNIMKRIGNNLTFIAKKGRWHFLLAVVLVSIKRLFRFAALVALVKALGVETDLLVVFLFQWMVYILMMFFPTPGASGGAELVFHTVFRSVIPPIDITMMGWRFLTYYFLMIAAALYLLFIRWRTGRII